MSFLPKPTAVRSGPSRTAAGLGGTSYDKVASAVSGDSGALRLDVHGIQRLASGHEQAIAFGATETHVAADLGESNLPDARAVRCENMHAVVSLPHPARA